MLRIVIVAAIPLATLVGMLVGIYIVADQWLHGEHGCAACGRPWHRIDQTEHDRSPNVRVITRNASPLPHEGDHND